MRRIEDHFATVDETKIKVAVFLPSQLLVEAADRIEQQMANHQRIEVGEPLANEELVRRDDVGIFPLRRSLPLHDIFQFLDPDASGYSRAAEESRLIAQEQIRRGVRFQGRANAIEVGSVGP